MRSFVIGMAAAGLVLSSGCVTMVDQSTMAQQQADLERMREDVQKLQEKVRGLEMAQEQMEQEVKSTRAGSRDDVVARNRLDTLERQVQSLAAARDADKREIVNKVANIVASPGGGSSSRSSSGRSSRGSSQTGYEHVVEAGQSLSAIAAAYKVSVSSIKQANNLKSSTVRVGQKLFIPKN